MIEIGVIVVLAALLGWEKHQNRKERAKMLNLIVAKDNKEAVNLELADKTEVKASSKDDEPTDYIPTSAVSDDEYFKMITGKKPKK